MRVLAVAIAVLITAAPTTALDWKNTEPYKELQTECADAVKAGTVWWFITTDRGGPYLTSAHLWDPQLTFGYELKAISLVYPTLRVAERAGLLAEEVPAGVPAMTPTSEWSKASEEAVRWVLDNQNEDGGWGQAWTYRGITHSGSQTSDTAAAIMLLIHEIERRYESGGEYGELVSAVRRGLTWLLDQQLEDGGWSRKKEEAREGAPWHTRAAVAALLMALEHRDLLNLDDSAVERIKSAIERGVSWLLERQNPDGSWYSGLMCQEYSADTQAYILSTLMDVYLKADRLGLHVDRDRILNAIRRGIEWLFNGEEAGVTWVEGSHGRGPAWAYSSAYLKAQGSPETTVTGNVLSLVLLKALWFDVATDVEIETPGGKRKLSDLVTDPEYNLHATVEWLVSQQYRETEHPEWYGAWPWPARDVTSTTEGAHYEPASIWATAYAMRALEAYLSPELFYGKMTKPNGKEEGPESASKIERKRGTVSGESRETERQEERFKRGSKRGVKGVPVLLPTVPPARRQCQRGNQHCHR
ncbi:prenyltransferase/squalene oxidase repeat-containing protein [Methanopyrus kandleri]